jgi:Ser/Thr protein kinase RdoA (MazF antagonist)
VEPADKVLAGGLGNEGRVVRRGDAVRRPAGPWTPAVHALLKHLESGGFSGAPRVLSLGDDVEWLEFVPGEVAIPPFPPWSASDDLLVSVAQLQRRLHAGAADFRPPPGAIWGDQQPPREFSGTLVCHNDLCLENVVVSGGHAIAFIDFDFARPVDRLWDIAIALRHWVPMRDPRDVDELRAHIDPIARSRLFLAAHDLDAPERVRTIDALLAFLDSALGYVRAHAEAGHSGHAAEWNAGYEAKNRRARRWIERHRGAIE